MDCVFLTCVHSQPEFLYLQDASYKKFMKQSFTFVVVDDSDTPAISERMKSICSELNYKYIRCPPHSHMEISSPSYRHAHALNYGWRALLHYEAKYVATLDTDLFPITPIDLDILLKDNSVATSLLVNKEFSYFWPGLTFFKVDGQPLEEVNWNLFEGMMCGSDTGGATSVYIEANSTEYPIRKFTIISGYNYKEDDLTTVVNTILPYPLKKYCLEDKAACEIHGIKWMYDLFLDEEHGMKFFHMKNVSNWSSDKEEYHSNKLKSFTAAINAILDSDE